MHLTTQIFQRYNSSFRLDGISFYKLLFISSSRYSSILPSLWSLCYGYKRDSVRMEWSMHTKYTKCAIVHHHKVQATYLCNMYLNVCLHSRKSCIITKYIIHSQISGIDIYLHSSSLRLRSFSESSITKWRNTLN